MKIRKIFKHLKRWYEGTPMVRVFKNPPDGNTVITPVFYEKRHWTAKLAKMLVEFYLSNWKWIWGIVIAAVSLFASL